MRTYCRICEAACGLAADVDARGQVVKILPDRDHPASRGYACAKGTRFHELARHEDRLLHPEVDGRRASWSEATQHIADRVSAIVERHGPHAVGIYFGNPMAFNALGLVATLAFAKALGTRNVFYAGTQDCSNKFAGADLVYGTPVIHPIPDFANTQLAVVLGSNPYVSQSSFIHLEGGGPAVFGELISRGGQAVWIDPRRTESAAKWGEHLAIVPGTDAWLMLALLRLVTDRRPKTKARIHGVDEALAAAATIDVDEAGRRTGLGAAAIKDLAARIDASPATAFHMSVGVNQGGFGTLCYVLLQVLSFVTGNLDRRGGSVFNPTGPIIERVHRWAGIENRHRSRIGGFASLLGTLPGGVLADEILEPGDDKIRAMLVFAGDPLRSIPGSRRLADTFDELELLACVDMFRSRTAQGADVVLPCASWLERWDLAVSTVPFQQAPLVQMSGPVAAPPGEVRTDARILSDLAIALHLRGPWRLGTLPLDGWLPAPKFGWPAPKVRPGRFLARRRTIHLWRSELDAEVQRLRSTPARPDGFILLCRRRRLAHNSWLHGGSRNGSPEQVAWMRTDDMARLGLEPGTSARLHTEAGELTIDVQARDELSPGTVVVPHGLPELGVNALIPAGADNVERLSGQLTMTGIPVEVSAA